MAKSTFPQDSLLTAFGGSFEALIRKAHDVSLAAGSDCISGRDAGDGCYRIEDGLLKVTSARRREERILAILGPGSIVGELSDDRWSATVRFPSRRTRRKLRLLSRAAFEAFGRSNPEVHRHVMILAARRLRDTNDRSQQPASCPSRDACPGAAPNLRKLSVATSAAGVSSCRQKVTQSGSAAMAGIAAKMSAAS